MNAQFSFCGLRKRFGCEIFLRGIQRCFPSSTAAASKISQGSEVFADFSGTFFAMVKKITFLNYGNLCMYKCSTNILHSLSSALRKITKCTLV